ncbi:MAG TPA: outer membrane beta-barrel protein [Chitinophagaceae bacterium]|nr:outer membrane beta-barrel protein [Chitinophagaceae bacterium]
MKIYLLVIIILTASLLTVQGQKEGSIKGAIKDTASGLLLNGATVTVLLAKDSSLVNFSRTNSNGYFSIHNLENGGYRLLVTHVGYINISKPFVISAALTDIDFGTLIISNKSTLLQEVTVIQEKPPVVIRNDTLEYNAGSFKTKPNAVVEDLLKKLPGIQVDKDGKVKSNGEEVKRVLVDGKEFFGNDPKMATKNLPADAIDKVQVFDRKSDQSRFTGFDDGNSEKTINLTIKPDKKNGVFGKATAGAGDKGLYQGSLNVNSFSGARQLSAIGMLNNTNKQGFSFMDILNFTGGLPGAGGRGGAGMQIDLNSMGLPIQGAANNQGITTTKAGGLNYNNTFQKNLDVTSSYFYNRLQTGKTEKVLQQWLLPGNNFNTTKDNNSNNTNESHRVNITGDYKIDSANSIKLSSSVNRQQSQYNINSNYNAIATAGNLLNDGHTNSFIEGDGYSWNNNALFRHRFPKKGRTFSANLSFNLNNSNSNGGLQSLNNYYLPNGGLQQSDTINQVNSQDNSSRNYGAVLSYTEPLSKKSLLEFNYNFNAVHSVSDKTTFDFDKLSGKHTSLNDALSNGFLNDYMYHRPGINWRFQQKKYNFTVGAAVQQASLDSKFHIMAKDSAIERSFVNFLPNAHLQYNVNQFKNIRVLYNTFTRQPSVTQLQPLTDNTDPLNIKVGNPDLKQEYYHRLQTEYISFDPYRHTSFFAALTAGLTGNKIVNADQVGAQGQRITQPVNVNGAYNVNVNTSWGFPVKKIKSKLNLNSSLAKTHNIGFVNAGKNNINAWNASQELTWNYTYKELLDLSAGAELIYNDVKYSLQKQQNVQYWNQHYTFEINLYLPKGFSFASDVDYTTRSGLAQGYNLTAVLWNAGIAKQVFKNKKGELRFQVYDILNQNIGVSRSSNQNYIEDLSYNVLKRFWQLSFTYNISRFAGKNIAAPGSKGSNIQVINQGRNQ